MRRSYVSPFDSFLFPRLSMNTRLLGFDDPFEELEREFSRDPFTDFDRMILTVVPQLGVPLTTDTDKTQQQQQQQQQQQLPSAAAGAGANQKQAQASQQHNLVADTKHVDTPSANQQVSSMDVDQAPQRLWLASYSRAPAIDVVDRDKEFQVTVDVPGVAKEDLKLQVTQDRRGHKLLTVSGERKEEKEEEDKQRGFRSSHRLYGHFSRSLRLPETCDTQGGIQAKHENGVLKITLPKLNPEAVKPQNVQINIA